MRAPLLIERVWIRRGRCGVCRRTHALLPDLVLARRLDEVALIGRALALRVMTKVGLGSIAEHVDVPHTTVRTWWRRFQTRSPTLLIPLHRTGCGTGWDGGHASHQANAQRLICCTWRGSVQFKILL